VALREGLSDTIMYLQRRMFGEPVSSVMLTNSFAMSATNFVSRRYQKLYVYWPVAVHPNLKRALLICYGIGNTAKAMTDTKSIEKIDVVDVSRDVLEMSRIIDAPKSDSPLDDPRVQIHIEDGRYFLRTTDQHFDLITGEPPPPGIAGVESLYSREYFQLLHDRLSEGGIVTYWLPLHSLSDASTLAILRAFCDAFSDCSLWNGIGPNLMMVGSRNAQGPAPDAQFVRQWHDSAVAAEMWRLGFELPEQLGALFIGDAAYLKDLVGGVQPLDDDHPQRIESPFQSPEQTERMLVSLTDGAAARERFESSPLIKQLWPEWLRTASLPYFDVQVIINSDSYRDLSWNSIGVTRPDPDMRMKMAHFLLSRTSLTVPLLLLWGSGPDVQQVLADAKPGELEQPSMQYQLALHLLSQRNYAAAVEPLNQAEQAKELNENAFILRIYALCMSGKTVEAQRFVQERFGQMIGKRGLTVGSIRETSLPPVWLWMKKTFGIDPLVLSN
jgi:spermidine synthase